MRRYEIRAIQDKTFLKEKRSPFATLIVARILVRDPRDNSIFTEIIQYLTVFVSFVPATFQNRRNLLKST